MLAHVIQADVAANQCTGFVLGLVHDLGVVGPVELGHGDTGSSQRVGSVAAAQLLLGNEVGVLGGHPPGSAASGKQLGTAVLPGGTQLPGRDLRAPGLKSHVQGFCLKGLAVLTLLAEQRPAFFSSQYPSAAWRVRIAQAGVVPSFSRPGNGVLVTTKREITVGFSLSHQKAPSRVIDS